MDVWQWVFDAQEELRDAGHDRLAAMLMQLPQLIVDGKQEAAEALFPEALALAREIDHAWLEVYLRHWIAQSRILHRYDVTGGMDDLIRLLDFAHEERTRECPQSVCVVQDVCSAYGILDGPGYVNERLAVATDTLARIDVSWSCFECISSEHAKALLDAGRYEDAEHFTRTQLAHANKHGYGSYLELKLFLVDALSLQGRHEEAAQLLEQHVGHENPYRVVDYRLHKSRELAILGRRDEAARCVVKPRDIDAGDYPLWARAAEALCAADVIKNDRRLDQTLRGFITTLLRNGSLYAPAEIALIAARLALARESDQEAAQYLDEAEALVPRLRSPERIVSAVQELRSTLVSRAQR